MSLTLNTLVFCGPKALGSTLHNKCNQYSEPGFSFVWYIPLHLSVLQGVLILLVIGARRTFKLRFYSGYFSELRNGTYGGHCMLGFLFLFM